MKKIRDKIQNAQSRRSDEKAHHIYETYKNTVMPHGCHIYVKAADMTQATMCTYPQSDHTLPHWECVSQCCAKLPGMNIPYQKTYNNYSETTPSIRFHIYHIIGRCTDHGRIPSKDKKICYTWCV